MEKQKGLLMDCPTAALLDLVKATLMAVLTVALKEYKMAA